MWWISTRILVQQNQISCGKEIGAKYIGPSMIDPFAVVDVGLFSVPIWILTAPGIAINLNRISSFTQMGFIHKTAGKIISKKDAMVIVFTKIRIT